MGGHRQSSSIRRYRRKRTRRGSARRRWPRRIPIGVSLLVLLTAAVGDCTSSWADSRLRRTAAFPDYEGRPVPGRGTNWLIVGSDGRSDPSSRERRRPRGDTVMLLHYGGSGANLISVPRDLLVTVPAHTGAHGARRAAHRNKINAAFSEGGAPLLTRTVERATGLRVDHYAEVDFTGFRGIVGALGGVRICLDKPVRDEMSKANLAAGCTTLNPQQALAFVRARSFDPEGDLGRVRRQQRFLGALADQALSPGALLTPFAFLPRLGSLLQAIRVDPGTDLAELARMACTLHWAGGKDAVVTTVPIADARFRAGALGEAVLWDEGRARAMFDAIRADRALPR